jgi:cobalt-zinc-cadmium efflux system outer membrane protein
MAEISGFEEVRLREGSVAEGVVLRARLERERARLALAHAEAEAQRAHAALAQAIGLPTAQLPRVAASPAATVGVPRSLPALASARESALGVRPEMLASRQRVEAARRGVSAAWRGTLPDVGLQLGAMETAGRGAAIVALSFELPLLDRGTATRARARGELALAEAELEATRRRVEAEVATALDVYQRLLDACPEETMALAEQGGEVAAVADVAYREGAITLVELLDARRARADARATAATWAAELALARIDLQRALGVPIGEGI